MAPPKPTTSAKRASTGMRITQARSRGTTSFFTGSAPRARMASICSVTAMAPSSAAMPEPMREPTTRAVSDGASSRVIDRPMTRPT